MHNYIDKYQEKLGLYGTKSKRTEVEKVLAFTHKDLLKKANEVIIDFESYRQAKANLIANSSVRSTLRDKCEKRGFPKKMIEKINPTEISMRAIKSAIKQNRAIRNDMKNTFKQGVSDYDYFNVIDEIRENAISNVTEEYADQLQGEQDKENARKQKYDQV